MAERNSRVHVSLTAGTMEKLERYAVARKSKPATEAMLILTQRLDELEAEGKIPLPPGDSENGQNTSKSDELVRSYVRMLASGIPVPDEIVKLVAKDMGLTEDELRGVGDRLSQ